MRPRPDSNRRECVSRGRAPTGARTRALRPPGAPTDRERGPAGAAGAGARPEGGGAGGRGRRGRERQGRGAGGGRGRGTGAGGGGTGGTPLAMRGRSLARASGAAGAGGAGARRAGAGRRAAGAVAMAGGQARRGRGARGAYATHPQGVSGLGLGRGWWETQRAAHGESRRPVAGGAPPHGGARCHEREPSGADGTGAITCPLSLEVAPAHPCPDPGARSGGPGRKLTLRAGREAASRATAPARGWAGGGGVWAFARPLGRPIEPERTRRRA
jgi:hypothetical protein